MACENSKTAPKCSIFVLVVLCYLLSFACGRKLLPIPKGTVKTVEIENHDVIIDCVDIYQQPAFDHPNLKNHTLQQMKPSGYPKEREVELYDEKKTIPLKDLFKELIECPENTIPISRKQKYYDHKRNRLLNSNINKGLNASLYVAPPTHEYAQVGLENGGPYYGAHAYINVWNPLVIAPEISIAQIWVVSELPGNDLNSIEAGWLVDYTNPGLTKFFTYWTRDSYKSTGCYDISCPGFVQTNPKFVFGEILTPVSVYDGNQTEIKIAIFKDPKSGNWWLKLQDEEVGYWPSSIFTSLGESASIIRWGGEIVNEKDKHGGQHTTTQMGSGHLPITDPNFQNFKKASYIRDLGYFDNSMNFISPQFDQLNPFAVKPECYNVDLRQPQPNVNLQTYFFFGGPGYSQACQT